MQIGGSGKQNYGRACKICGEHTGVAFTCSSSCGYDDGTAICNDCYNRVYVKNKQGIIDKLKVLKQTCLDENQLNLISEIELYL